jgi:uncharacterized protein (TIGR04255 family)
MPVDWLARVVKQLATPGVAMKSALPDYQNPPVTEVVLGAYFDSPLPEFRIPHTGLFWHRIRDKFPHVQHAGPVTPSGDIRWMDEITGIPMPRVWFLSEDKSNIVQLQGDCFFYNWRKQGPDQTYPRYRTLIEEYEKQRDGFLEFLKDSRFPEPKPMTFELTYVNHIPRGQGWQTIDDLASIFKDFSWSKDKEMFPIPKSLSWSCTFDLPENGGTLAARMTQVTRVNDPAVILRLDMVCKGLGNVTSLRESRPWFELAHEWIVRGFSDLTTASAQKELWKRNV